MSVTATLREGRETPAAPVRLASVESMRVLASIAVLCIHAGPFGHATGRLVVGTAWDAATIVNQLSRFAVPCFFVLSGVFWERRTADRQAIWPVTRRSVGRLLLLFVGWSLVFVLPWEGDRLFPDFPARWWANVQGNVRWIGRHPWRVVFAGTNGHLWFLMALAQATLLAALLKDRRSHHRVALGIGVGLFVVYLLATPYHRTTMGITLRFTPRYGPCVAFPFFAVGMWLGRRAPGPSWARLGGWIALGGIGLSAMELTWLHATTGASLVQDVVIGTAPFGIGMAMVALSGHPWLTHPRLAALGGAVLGIYASHLLFVELLAPVATRMRSAWWDLMALGLVFALSLGLTTALARWRGTRWLVR